jgi:hypothetical protein
MRRAWLIAAVVAASALAPAAAKAGSPLPAPAVAQYVESFPTSAGPAVPGAETTRVRKLPPAVERTIVAEGGTDSDELEAIATSSTYSAPQTTLKKSKPSKKKKPSPRPAVARNQPALPADTFSTDGSGDSRLPILGGLLLLATAGLGVAARRLPA